MPLKKISPKGYVVLVDARAEVVLDGGKIVSSFPVSSWEDDEILIPRDSTGVVKLKVDVTFTLKAPSVPDMNLTKSKTIHWHFSKQGNLVVFPRTTVSPTQDMEWMGGDITCKMTPSSKEAERSVSLLFSVKWDYEIGVDSETMDFSLTLTNHWRGTVTVEPRTWLKSEVSFLPFATGRKDRLERAILLNEVRAWYHGLHPDVQKMMERALSPTDMPGGEPLLIEGYTSTSGKEVYNWGLGWARAQAVKEILRKTTGNNVEALYKTPSRSEGPRPTDKRREEDNRPEWRKVVVTYWNAFDKV